MKFTSNELASYIDHTNLKPNATKEDIKKLCSEAIDYKFKGVCVNPSAILYAKELLKGKKIKLIAAVGFPLGASQSSSKAFETKEAISSGADEIDMVINIGALKEKQYDVVYQDICAVVNEAGPHVVKVILETCFLDRDEKIIACALAKVANASFVKTSTGFGPKGASTEDVTLMKSIIGNDMEVKASGGIKTLEDALKMIAAGATRLGTSQSVKIINELS